MASTYRLKFVRGDFQFEAEGDKKFVLDMWRKIQAHILFKEEGIAVKKTAGKIRQQINKLATSKSMSVGEFVKQLNIKKHTMLVLAFGYYLEKFDGMDAFGPADINKCYYDAKMDSSNTSQMIIQNIKTNRMMEARGATKKGHKRYTLTQTGVDIIEKTLAKAKSV